MNKDKIIIDGKKFNSRLIMGTAQYPNIDVLNKSLQASETEIVTVVFFGNCGENWPCHGFDFKMS